MNLAEIVEVFWPMIAIIAIFGLMAFYIQKSEEE